MDNIQTFLNVWIGPGPCLVIWEAGLRPASFHNENSFCCSVPVWPLSCNPNGFHSKVQTHSIVVECLNIHQTCWTYTCLNNSQHIECFWTFEWDPIGLQDNDQTGTQKRMNSHYERKLAEGQLPRWQGKDQVRFKHSQMFEYCSKVQKTNNISKMVWMFTYSDVQTILNNVQQVQTIQYLLNIQKMCYIQQMLNISKDIFNHIQSGLLFKHSTIFNICWIYSPPSMVHRPAPWGSGVFSTWFEYIQSFHIFNKYSILFKKSNIFNNAWMTIQ